MKYRNLTCNVLKSVRVFACPFARLHPSSEISSACTSSTRSSRCDECSKQTKRPRSKPEWGCSRHFSVLSLQDDTPLPCDTVLTEPYCGHQPVARSGTRIPRCFTSPPWLSGSSPVRRVNAGANSFSNRIRTVPARPKRALLFAPPPPPGTGEEAFWKYSDALFNGMEAYADKHSF